jgi:hypothetical protein
VQDRFIWLFAIVFVATPFARPQGTGVVVADAPQILIELPNNISSEAVWIRYVLMEPGSTGAVVKREPNLRRYTIDARIAGQSAHHAKVVVYAPGCQFKHYRIKLDGTSDVSKRFRCETLPSTIVHGFLPPTQIPASRFPTTDKKLVISAEFEPAWVCEFFLEQKAGSCLGAGIPLGVVGNFDPADRGGLTITIPDFARDPLSKTGTNLPQCITLGTFLLLLRQEETGRPLGAIWPKRSSPESGLGVESKYLDPIEFTTAR